MFKPSAPAEKSKPASRNWRGNDCEAENDDGTALAGCSKLYVPLDAEGASAAPYGFVFRLTKTDDDELVWNFIAFGERHPENPSTRSVYERAHKRLRGRYPNQSP